ncbi:MAG TPA: hypothetical protein VNJ03_16590 [Vicinamibacterales bacterium]|nr:hypothetical protein [Vicinamibacterales bacterium]
MATRNISPSDVPADLDPIAALHDAIIQASEENWQWNDVPEAERARLRPGVATIAEEATSRLRSEHIARTSGGKA